MLHDQNVSKTDIDFMDTTYSKWGGSLLSKRWCKKRGKESPQRFQYGESLDHHKSNFNMCSLEAKETRQPTRLLIVLFN